MGKQPDGRAEIYRRQLGGTQAALNRARQRERDLEALLREAVGLLARAGWPDEEDDEEAWSVLGRAGKMGIEV